MLSIDHEQDLKARSVQPRMNLNQYRVKNFQSEMKVSQSCQTGPQEQQMPHELLKSNI